MAARRSGKTKTDRITAFPDTNIFLHFEPFDQIPWRKELNAATVELHVTATVVSELNKHGDKHTAGHVQERARKTLRRIRECILDGTRKVTDGVFITCDLELEGFDMASHRLDPSSQDDCILAAIISHKERHPDARVVLITDDAPFAVRAHTKGVHSIALSESLRLPSQQDAKSKEIRELKEKLREVERRLPRLTLAFPEGKEFLEVAFGPDVSVTEADAQAYVRSQVAPAHPTANAERWQALASEPKLMRSAEVHEAVAPWLDLMSSFAEFMATKAATDREVYLNRYAAYFLAWWKYTNVMQRTKELRLVLTNTGTAPAEEINIFLQVPKSVDIFPSGGLPLAPPPPLPPGQKPHPLVPGAKSVKAENVQSIRYVRATEYPGHWELQYQLARLNHHVTEVFAGLHVRFPPHPNAKPLRIQYRIAALNMPDPAAGALDVVPKDSAGKMKRITRRGSGA